MWPMVRIKHERAHKIQKYAHDMFQIISLKNIQTSISDVFFIKNKDYNQISWHGLDTDQEMLFEIQREMIHVVRWGEIIRDLNKSGRVTEIVREGESELKGQESKRDREKKTEQKLRRERESKH